MVVSIWRSSSTQPSSLHCALAGCGTVYCNRSCLSLSLSLSLSVCVCVCVCACGWVCYHDNSKLRTFIDPHQTWFVGKLIKFWPFRALGKGVCGGRKFWLRLITASAQCLRLFWALFSFYFLLCNIISYIALSINTVSAVVKNDYNLKVCFRFIWNST